MSILYRWRARRHVHARVTELALYHAGRAHKDWTRITSYLPLARII